MYNTALKRIFDPWGDLWGYDEFFNSSRQSPSEVPSVCYKIEDEEAIIFIELPGVHPDDVDISIKGKNLTISGERKAEDITEDAGYHHRERWHGKFSRSLVLPYMVEADKVEAKFELGILKLSLPRAEADKPRKIEISVN